MTTQQLEILASRYTAWEASEREIAYKRSVYCLDLWMYDEGLSNYTYKTELQKIKEKFNVA